jgi:hypothetical protein
MLALRHRGKPATWPFALLVLAWFCANSPQSLTFNVIVWARGARHFSHQERLKAEVAFLLAGPHRRAVLAAASPPPPAPPVVPVPDEAVVRKIDLAAAGQAALGILPAEAVCFVSADFRAGPAERAEPPLAPPRDAPAV